MEPVRRRGRATPASGGSVHSTQGASAPPAGSPEFRVYEGDTVQGGNLTLDLIAAHNIDFPSNKVSLSDLKPSTDPEFKCKGTVPLKNGILTCGCFVRSEAPDPLTHQDVAGFDSMSKDSLRRLIIKLYDKVSSLVYISLPTKVGKIIF